MKKLIKWIITATLLTVLASFYCASAMAEVSYSGVWGTLTWTLDNAGTLVISGSGEMSDLSYSTDDAWRAHKAEIKKVILEPGVTSTGNFAFYECSILTEATLPTSVTKIGVQTFGGCSSLTSITIPENVTSIGNYAFSRCRSLTNISVDADNTNFSDIEGVLYNKDKTVLNVFPIGRSGEYSIPAGVTGVKDRAFTGCAGLTAVVIPSSVTYIGERAFEDCSGLTSIEIPDGVTIIEGWTFNGCTLMKSVSLPTSVTSLDTCAFQGCKSLKKISLPLNLNTIASNVFFRCDSLEAVSIPSSVARIGNNAFQYCDCLKDVYFGGDQPQWEGIIKGQNNDQLQSATIHYNSDMPGILDSGVWGNNIAWELDSDGLLTLTGEGKIQDFPSEYSQTAWYPHRQDICCVVINDGITSIGVHAFLHCSNLLEVSVPESITRIGDGAFYGCNDAVEIYYAGGKAAWLSISKSSPNLPENAVYHYGKETTVGKWGNLDWTLTNDGLLTISGNGEMDDHNSNYEAWLGAAGMVSRIVIEPGVESIGKHAFYYCVNATEFTIPYTIKSIREDAVCNYSVGGVHVDRHVYYDGSKAEWWGIKHQFSNTGLDMATLHFAEDYSAGTWGALTWSLTNEGILTISGEGTMDDFLPASEEAWHIGAGIIEKVVFNNSLTEIGDYAFENCSALKDISLPVTVNRIGEGAFYECRTLPSIAIPDGVQVIEERAFYNCRKIDFIELPTSLDLIASSTFYKCSSLTNVIIPDNITSIGEYAFAYCSGLDYVKISGSMESISDNAFYSCWYLTTLSIPSGVSRIGIGAFSGCSLTDIYYEGTRSQWEAITIETLNESVTTATLHCSRFSIGINDQIQNGVISVQVNGNSTDTAAYGDIITMIAYPDEGYEVDSISVNTVNGEATTVEDMVFNMPEDDVIISCTFKHLNYIVTWLNDEGGLIDTTTVEYGQFPDHADAIKENNAEYSYSFAEWMPEFEPVTGDATYTAQFTRTRNSYTITWLNDDGGLIDTTIVEYGQLPSHSDPSKENTAEFIYTFAGWTPEIDNVTGDATYQAVFDEERIEHVVSFDANGGHTAPEAQVKYGGTVLVLTTEEPVRDFQIEPYYVNLDANGGIVDPSLLTASKMITYSFRGWNTSPDGSGTYFEPGGSYTYDEDVMLYAQWGSSAELSAVSLPTPLRDWHDFLGWAEYSDAAGGITGYFTTESNVTLYAIWKKQEFTVAYEANGGTAVPESQVKTYGEDLILSDGIPVKDGCVFLGWSLAPEAKAADFLPGDSFLLDADTTLYAVWLYIPSEMGENYLNESPEVWLSQEAVLSWGTVNQANYYTVDIELYEKGKNICTYSGQPGKDGIDVLDNNGISSCDLTGYIDGLCNQMDLFGKQIQVRASMRPYVIKEGSVDQIEIYGTISEFSNMLIYRCQSRSLGRPLGIELSPSGVLSWNAIPGADTYRLEMQLYYEGTLQLTVFKTLNSGSDEFDGGNTCQLGSLIWGACNNKSLLGKIVSVRARIEPSGYVNDGIERYPASGVMSSYSEAVEFYFEPDNPEGTEYTVNYDANGGTAAPESQVKTYGEDLILSDSIPVKDGCIFLGWAFVPDATKADYLPGDSFSLNADTTLYAVWLEPDFTLPASLTTIEEEAFTGASATFVKLPETAKEIQNRAFAECPNLRYIYIPATTTSIHRNAFENVTGLTVLGEEGNYAAYYASIYHFDFIAIPS